MIGGLICLMLINKDASHFFKIVLVLDILAFYTYGDLMLIFLLSVHSFSLKLLKLGLIINILKHFTNSNKGSILT